MQLFRWRHLLRTSRSTCSMPRFPNGPPFRHIAGAPKRLPQGSIRLAAETSYRDGAIAGIDSATRDPDHRQRMPPLNRLFSFLQFIVSSGKDWDDETATRMPGVRDRVVRIYHKEDEGGLNLKLTGDQIMDFASGYGQTAGKALVEKFIDRSDNNKPSAGWNEHRWVRFNTFLVGLRERIEALRASAPSAAYCKPLSQQILDARQRTGRSEDPIPPESR